MSQTLSTPTTIDVRRIEPRERHATIFAAFDALQPGQALEIVNDHDPRPLRLQLQARAQGDFSWTYLQAGPELWRVAIARPAATATGHASGGCCGACGGAA